MADQDTWRETMLSRGDRLVVGVSGGKDSSATCLHLEELGLTPDDYDRVFCDTGWELPEVYAYIDGPLQDRIGQITTLQPTTRPLDPDAELWAQHFEERLGRRSAMVRLVLQRAAFPSRQFKFCSQELKRDTVADHFASLDFDPINVIGVRREESRARSNAAEWEWTPALDAWTWRPLVRWTWDDVVAIHTRHGLRPAPPYLAGMERVGCAPCVGARKAELRWLAEHAPDRMALLGDLERVVTALAEARKGEALANPRTWFQDPNPPRGPGGKVIRDFPGYSPTWPIARILEWADDSTSQIELFALRPDAGCSRWGLCDTGREVHRG